MKKQKAALRKIYPIFIPFSGCGQRCIYCQQEIITRTNQIDFAKIKLELAQFCAKNADYEKEAAFFGGSFTLLPQAKQEEYIAVVKPYLTLLTGIRISTRPDGINQKSLEFCKKNGIKTIELGIQSFSDRVLTAVNRPYSKKLAGESALMVQSHGFKLTIQLMPGLPADSDDSIEETIRETIRIKPDFVRIYPTIVLRGTELEQEYQVGKYQAWELEKAVTICANMIRRFTEAGISVIKTGLHSDISYNEGDVIAGPYHPAFAELVTGHILYQKIMDSCRNSQGSFYEEEQSDDDQVHYSLLISPKNISVLKGNGSILLNKLRNNLSIKRLPISLDESLGKYDIVISETKPDYYW